MEKLDNRTFTPALAIGGKFSGPPERISSSLVHP